MYSRGSEWFYGNSVKIFVEVISHTFLEVYKYQKNTQKNL